MTYCLAIRVNSGMVFASDSRTNAGVDHVNTYSKMHVITPARDRLFVLLTAGNLATTQALVNTVNHDLDDPAAELSLANAPSLFDAADYVGRISTRIQSLHAEALKAHNACSDASFILGGQIGDQTPDILLVYPEGNCINASPDSPFLQIGETKYGKPILDRIITSNTRLEDAARCALVSIDSTIRSNISVGPPIELAMVEKGRHQVTRYLSLKLDSPMYTAMQDHWSDGLHLAFGQLPRFEWEQDPEN